jgi:hypothetical protein
MSRKVCKCGCGAKPNRGKDFLPYHHLRLRKKMALGELKEALTKPVETGALETNLPAAIEAEKFLTQHESALFDGPSAVIGAVELNPFPNPVFKLVEDGPPAYPAAIDRRLWRLAEDRPNTPPTNPWIETKCGNCLERMWARDPEATWERGGLCQECLYYIVSEQTQARVNAQNRTAPTRRGYDPFSGMPK